MGMISRAREAAQFKHLANEVREAAKMSPLAILAFTMKSDERLAAAYSRTGDEVLHAFHSKRAEAIARILGDSDVVAKLGRADEGLREPGSGA